MERSLPISCSYSYSYYFIFLELGQAPRARVCAEYGHLSLLPMRLAPYYCCYYPGVGHHAHPASLQAGLRPTSSCPCPCSPSNVRLGCLSLRRRAWSRRRCARSGGVSHLFEMRVESPLKSSPPPAAVPVQTVRHRAPPGCRPRRRAGAGPAAGAARGRRDGVKRPFEFPIRQPHFAHLSSYNTRCW